MKYINVPTWWTKFDNEDRILFIAITTFISYFGLLVFPTFFMLGGLAAIFAGFRMRFWAVDEQGKPIEYAAPMPQFFMVTGSIYYLLGAVFNCSFS